MNQRILPLGPSPEKPHIVSLHRIWHVTDGNCDQLLPAWMPARSSHQAVHQCLVACNGCYAMLMLCHARTEEVQQPAERPPHLPEQLRYQLQCHTYIIRIHHPPTHPPTLTLTPTPIHQVHRDIFSNSKAYIK